MYVLLIVLVGCWWGVVVLARRRGSEPGASPAVQARLLQEQGGDEAWDPPRMRPTLDDAEGWLAVAVLAVTAFVLAQAAIAVPVRGIALVVGLLVIARHEEQTTRVRPAKHSRRRHGSLGSQRDLPGDLAG